MWRFVPANFVDTAKKTFRVLLSASEFRTHYTFRVVGYYETFVVIDLPAFQI